MEKSNAEQQLELQNHLASLQVNNENLSSELSKRDQQLAEVMSRLCNHGEYYCVCSWAII